MAKFSLAPLLIAAVLLAEIPQFSGQTISPGAAPPPLGDCNEYFFNVSDCESFVTPESNLTQPDPGCCTGFATMVNERPICLCQLLGNPSALAVAIDVNRLPLLQNTCNVTGNCTAPADLPPSRVPSPAPLVRSNSASTKHFMIGLSAAALLMYFI